MYPPPVLYEVAQRRQAEELRRAETWRRGHPEVLGRQADEPAAWAVSPRRRHRHRRLVTVLAVGAWH